MLSRGTGHLCQGAYQCVDFFLVLPLGLFQPFQFCCELAAFFLKGSLSRRQTPVELALVLCQLFDFKADRSVKLVSVGVFVIAFMAAALFLQLAQIAEVPLPIACGAVRDLGPHTVPAAAMQQTG